MTELNLGIAGLRTAVVTDDPNVAAVIEDHYRGFLASGPVDWRLEIRRDPDALRDATTVNVRREGAPRRFTARRFDFAGTLDLGMQTAELRLAEPDDVAINSFLRILYSLALAQSGGLVLHAASLVRNERAYVFCGPSGSGKTTAARLSTDATLLSDELSILRVIDGRVLCFGTPFRGELALAGADRGAPVAGIYFLHHGPRHVATTLTARVAVTRLLRNVLWFVTEPDVTVAIFRVAAMIIDGAPSFDLSFRRDPGFWGVLQHA
jgi:hypothetical protein